MNYQCVVMNHLKKHKNFSNPKLFEVCDYIETSAVLQTEQVTI